MAFALCILGFLMAHAVPALLSGLLMFLVTRKLKDVLAARAPARLRNVHVAGVLAGFLSVGLLVLVILIARTYLGADALGPMMMTATDTLQNLKHYLPADISAAIPDRIQDVKDLLVATMKEHSKELAGAGTGMLHGLLQVVLGWAIGIFIAINPMKVNSGSPLFAQVWLDAWIRLCRAFSAVARGQAKIAALNAVVSGIFLFVVMPLFGWPLPFVKTMILVTFICGLIPVVGNFVSNTVLCAIALTVSFHAALAVLIFMLIAHKVELLFSARIQGHSMGACIWELLIVLFVMEFLFGPAGMVLAPVLYSFGKHLLMDKGWLDSPNSTSGEHGKVQA